MEYKKISAITKELNIYKSLIYKLINQVLKDELKDHTKKINNVLYLDTDGIKIIKNHLKITNERVINKKNDNDINIAALEKKLDDILDTLKEILNVLQKPNIEDKIVKKTNIEDDLSEKKNNIEIDFEIKDEYPSPEVAVILGISKKYISEIIRKNKLKGTKKGNKYYIKHDDLMDYINNYTK